MLCLLLRCFKRCIVLVLPRKARPDMVGKLWTGTFMSPAKSSASVMSGGSACEAYTVLGMNEFFVCV